MSRYLLSTANSYANFSNDSPPMICNNSHVRAFSQVVLPTLYSLVFIVGILGNGLVMCVLAKHLQKSNMMDVCLFNLAVSDVLFLVTLPFWAHYSAIQEWTFGDSMCHIVTALHVLGFYSSIFFMLLMTIDRYVVTVHALSSLFFKRSSGRVGAALVLSLWVLSVGVSLPDIVYSKVLNDTSRTVCDNAFPSPTWKLAGYIQLNVLGLLLPLVVMGFCYSQIIPTLVAMKSKQRFKAIKLMLVMIVIFFLCWTPYNLVAFLQFLWRSDYLAYIDNCTWQANLGLAMPWVETIAYSHCCLNPFIYVIMGQRFRTLVIKTLKEWFPMCFSNLITSQLKLKRNSMRSSVMYSTTVV